MVTSNMTIIQEALALLRESGLVQPADVEISLHLRGQQAQVQALAANNTAVSYLITPLPDTAAADHQLLTTLQQLVQDTFSLDELQTLCFTLGVPFDDLPEGGLARKAAETVTYLQRRGRLVDLTTYGRQQRPNSRWPDIAPPAAIPDRKDLAVVVSVSQPALPGAAAYLDGEGIPAHFVLLTNVPAYDHTELLGQDNWEGVAQLFFQTMQTVRLQFPQTRLHFFLAAPLALCFLLGCTWGTVYQGDYLYHLHRDEDNRSRYVRVATITRQLREQPKQG